MLEFPEPSHSALSSIRRGLDRGNLSRLIKLIGIVLPLILIGVGRLECQAAPKTGPDRPFTLRWRVVASPAPNLSAVAFAPGTLNAVIVGESGTILRTKDGGKNWTRPSVPSGFKASLSALAFAGPSDAIAAGDDGTILQTSDGGETWNRSPIEGISARIRAVTFLDMLNGIAVGDAGTILRTQDAGKSWHRARVPSGVGNLAAVAFGKAGTGIAVGSNESILTTTDGGENWNTSTITAARETRTEIDLSAILFLGEKVALAAGSTSDHLSVFEGANKILRTDDGGITWQRVAMPLGISVSVNAIMSKGDMKAVAIGDGAHVWSFRNSDGTTSAGGAAGFGGAVLLTEDGGRIWKLAEVQSKSVATLRSIAATGDVTAITVGDRGSILRTEDAATNWTPATLPTSVNANLEAVAFADGSHGIAVGSDGVILWTEDGGKTFERSIPPIGIESETLKAVAITSPSREIAVGARSALLLTEDRGASWQEPTFQPRIETDLNAVKFVDPLNGLAVGQAGTVLRTDDGGKTWEKETVPSAVAESDLSALAFVDPSHAVGVGSRGTILRTETGGKVWEQVLTGVTADLTAIAFNGASVGVAIGNSGTVLRSDDGGKKWQLAKVPADLGNLNAVAFLDGSNCVAVGDVTSAANGDRATVIWSDDAGKNWNLGKAPQRLGNLNAVTFANTQEGVAVGNASSVDGIDTGTIIWTADGGKNWERSTLAEKASIPGVNLEAVALTAVSSGAAVGNGLILSTRDTGKHWAPASVLSRPEGLDLRNVALNGDVGVAVGARGVRLAGEKPIYAPYLEAPENSVHQTLSGSIELNLNILDDEGNPARISAVEYSLVLKDRSLEWKSLNSGLTKSLTDGHWRMTWSPSDEAIGNGVTIQHRVFLDDGGPPLPPSMLNPVVFRSFWDRVSDYEGSLWTATGIATLAAIYLGPMLVLLWLAPGRLALAGSGTLDAVGAAADSGTGWSKAVSGLLRQLALPWFKRRPRVRSAWLYAYRERKTEFAKLAKEVRDQFLQEDDVSDAWVARRIGMARDALAELPLYKGRSTYIPFPVHLGDPSTGETIDTPGPRGFDSVFARDRAILCIVGGGGSGKTTLACALARWAMAEEAPNRLMTHLAIPVIVAEETKDLVATVAAGLSRMVGSEQELEIDIVRALLRRKRVLVIVDALSERSSETQDYIHQLYGSDTPINAIIITTRREPELGPVEHTKVYPLAIDLRLLVPFILEYLRRQSLTNKFDPREQLALAQNILQIVERGGGLTVTPLLVTLFVDTAVARASTSKVQNLPVDVPEVYLDYLDRLNPLGSTTPNRVEPEVMRKTAFILAQASLGADLVPTDFRRDDAEQRLRDAGLDQTRALTDRLIANGVVQERAIAGLSLLRFQYDPVAEYLAAIATCRTLGNDEQAWGAMIGQLTAMQTYPDVIRGYLNALSVCYASYRLPLKLAAVELPWLDDGRPL